MMLFEESSNYTPRAALLQPESGKNPRFCRKILDAAPFLMYLAGKSKKHPCKTEVTR